MEILEKVARGRLVEDRTRESTEGGMWSSKILISVSAHGGRSGAGTGNDAFPVEGL